MKHDRGPSIPSRPVSAAAPGETRVWAGRLPGRRSIPEVEAFQASIGDDRALFREEIAASCAYARALARADVLTETELARILTGLDAVQAEIAAGLDLSGFEDIHSAVEILFTRRIGAAGGKLHSGRSRNEQVVVIEKLYLKRRLPEVIALVRGVQRHIVALAAAHPRVVMPAYTHLQQAQPVLFSHYVLALFWALQRGAERLRQALDRLDESPLGVGALAGCFLPLDRRFLARELGFARVSANSIDTVSDRGYILDTLFALALILLDLSRYAEDFVVFSSREFGFLELDDATTTSSSLMPQKRNPDVFELVRAKAGSVYGALTALFVTLKGVPGGYSKDLQQDKRPLLQGVEEAAGVLRVFALALEGVRPCARRMAAAMDEGMCATELVEALMRRGMAFREAYTLVAAAVHAAGQRGKSLSTLSAAALRRLLPLSVAEVREALQPRRALRGKRTEGSTAPRRVRQQLRRAERLLAGAEREIHTIFKEEQS